MSCWHFCFLVFEGDPEVFKHPPVTNTDSHPILQEEVEAAVKSLKPGKSAGVNNIPAELLQAGGETMIDVLLNICNKIWQTGEWPTPLDLVAGNYSSKERQPAPVSELSHN